jgi:hypothetical protein
MAMAIVGLPAGAFAAAAPARQGQGTGTLNGVAGATIRFSFTDAGEPGREDTAEFTIMGPNGAIAYDGGAIDGGNHQAHRS